MLGFLSRSPFLSFGVLKWVGVGLLIVAFAVILFYTDYLREENNKLKSERTLLRHQLETCQKTNTELTTHIQTQKEKYQKKVAELLRLANKPPREVVVPVVVEKPVPITNEECQKMGAMVDEFVRIWNEERK